MPDAEAAWGLRARRVNGTLVTWLYPGVKEARLAGGALVRDLICVFVDNIQGTKSGKSVSGTICADRHCRRHLNNGDSAAVAAGKRTRASASGNHRGSLETGGSPAGAHPVRAVWNLSLSAARDFPGARVRGVARAASEPRRGCLGANLEGCGCP